MNEYILEVAESGERLDKYLSEEIEGLTRTQAVNLIEAGNCTINCNSDCNSDCISADKKYRVKSGNIIKITIPEAEPADILPENIPLDILYEDDYVIVVNKPRGMIVHPARGVYSGTLVNALMFHCRESLSQINGVIRPGIVHRIDKDTSGLLVAAKNDTAHLSLSEQLKNRTMVREYEAIVHGNVKQSLGTVGEVDAPIGRSVSDRKKMCVTSKNSREALTYYETVEHLANFTHVRLRLHTGRTHQIRVHMAFIGHSVAGDSMYSNSIKKTALSGGQCLHARKLIFAHPKSGEQITIESGLPNYFTEFLEKLKKN